MRGGFPYRKRDPLFQNNAYFMSQITSSSQRDDDYRGLPGVTIPGSSGDILPCINGSWEPLTSMKSLFSRRQNTRGGGRPDALHDNVAFSPSRTETSPSEVPEFRISGGTEKKKKEDNIAKSGKIMKLKIVLNNYVKISHHLFALR